MNTLSWLLLLGQSWHLLSWPGLEGDMWEEPSPLCRVLAGRAGDLAEALPVQHGAGGRHQRECPHPLGSPCLGPARGQGQGQGQGQTPA